MNFLNSSSNDAFKNLTEELGEICNIRAEKIDKLKQG